MPPARERFNKTHPVLQTRVPEEFYHRIKAEAAARKLSLAQFLVTLLDEHTRSTPDLVAIKDQWKEDGWIECASSILARFREVSFCDIDVTRLTELLQEDGTRWAKIAKALRDAGGEESGAGPIPD